jgi:hypothetical protein
VRAVNRSGRADVPAGVDIVAADASSGAEARQACRGASGVYDCASPPYAKWPQLHPPLIDAIIEATGAVSATLVFGDNLYAYGAVDGSHRGFALSGHGSERAGPGHESPRR